MHRWPPLEQHFEGDGKKFKFEEGDKVYIKTLKCEGVIRFIGYPPGAYSYSWKRYPIQRRKYMWIVYGIELDDAKGDNDGVFHGHRYFQTKQHCAFFVLQRDEEIIL